MRRILLLLVLLGITGGIRADLGLNLTIPGFAKGVSAAINQGVVTLIKANATTRAFAEQDETGVFIALAEVVNNVTSPLNRLLGTALSSAYDKSGRSQTLFANLATLVNRTQAALDKALVASNDLEWGIRAVQFDGIQGNVSVIASNLSQLQDDFTVLSTAVSLAENSEVPVTLENVSEFFPSSIVNSVVHSLEYITRGVNQLGPIITDIVKDKTNAMKTLASTNTSLINAERALNAPSSAFNRSANDANSTTTNSANNLQSAILQLYATITGRPQNYNGGDIGNLNAFLTNFSASINQFNANVSQTFQQVRENVTTLVANSINQTAQVLIDVSKNITGRVITSGSPFVDRCAARYAPQLTQTPVQVSRIGLCLQSETGSFGPVTQIARMLLDQTKTLAGSSSAAIQSRQCTAGLTACSVVHFDRFADLSEQVQDKLAMNSDLIGREIETIQARVQSCTRAIRTDIDDNAGAIWNKFEDCLSSGA